MAMAWGGAMATAGGVAMAMAIAKGGAMVTAAAVGMERAATSTPEKTGYEATIRAPDEAIARERAAAAAMALEGARAVVAVVAVVPDVLRAPE